MFFRVSIHRFLYPICFNACLFLYLSSCFLSNAPPGYVFPFLPVYQFHRLSAPLLICLSLFHRLYFYALLRVTLSVSPFRPTSYLSTGLLLCHLPVLLSAFVSGDLSSCLPIYMSFHLLSLFPLAYMPTYRFVSLPTLPCLIALLSCLNFCHWSKYPCNTKEN